MSRGRGDGDQKKGWLTWVVVLAILCGGIYLYTKKQGASGLEYGGRSFMKLGSSYLAGSEDGDGSSSKYREVVDDGIILKSIPVSNRSKLIYAFAFFKFLIFVSLC